MENWQQEIIASNWPDDGLINPIHWSGFRDQLRNHAPKKPLGNKIAIVTGASAPKGIGRAIAMRLADDGATIVAADIDEAMEVNGKKTSRLDLLNGVAVEN